MNKQDRMYVRAWVPNWGAERDSFGNPWPQPKVDSSMWFVGHTQESLLQDDVLEMRVLAAIERGVTEAYEFHDYLKALGYTTFSTAYDGTVFVAQLEREGVEE